MVDARRPLPASDSLTVVTASPTARWLWRARRSPTHGQKKGGPRLGTALDVRSVRTLGALPALTPTLATNRGLTLPLPLGARLLVVATLTKLRIEARALHFPLEAAQSAVEALVVLYDDFQDDHILW